VKTISRLRSSKSIARQIGFWCPCADKEKI